MNCHSKQSLTGFLVFFLFQMLIQINGGKEEKLNRLFPRQMDRMRANVYGSN